MTKTFRVLSPVCYPLTASFQSQTFAVGGGSRMTASQMPELIRRAMRLASAIVPALSPIQIRDFTRPGLEGDCIVSAVLVLPIESDSRARLPPRPTLAATPLVARFTRLAGLLASRLADTA